MVIDRRLSRIPRCRAGFGFKTTHSKTPDPIGKATYLRTEVRALPMECGGSTPLWIPHAWHGGVVSFHEPGRPLTPSDSTELVAGLSPVGESVPDLSRRSSVEAEGRVRGISGSWPVSRSEWNRELPMNRMTERRLAAGLIRCMSTRRLWSESIVRGSGSE